MKYFLDTEFIEDGKTIDLISLGLVREDGSTLYLQNTECDFSKASDWVWRNVFPHLAHFDMRGRRACGPRVQSYDSGLGRHTIVTCGDSVNDPCPWATRREIEEKVVKFCSETSDKPEFWGYYADYDWVVFCQLFGPMIELPKGFPMYCRDVKQLADELGDIQLPKPDVEVHHALVDAMWVKEAHRFLLARTDLRGAARFLREKLAPKDTFGDVMEAARKVIAAVPDDGKMPVDQLSQPGGAS